MCLYEEYKCSKELFVSRFFSSGNAQGQSQGQLPSSKQYPEGAVPAVLGTESLCYNILENTQVFIQHLYLWECGQANL